MFRLGTSLGLEANGRLFAHVNKRPFDSKSLSVRRIPVRTLCAAVASGKIELYYLDVAAFENGQLTTAWIRSTCSSSRENYQWGRVV